MISISDSNPNNFPDENQSKTNLEAVSLISKDLPTTIQETLKNQIFQLKNVGTITQEQLMQNVEKLYSNDIVQLHYALTKFRHYISTEGRLYDVQKKIQFILNLNIMKYLKLIIQTPNQQPLILNEAAWILMNILSGTNKQLIQVLENDGILLLQNLLKCEMLLVQEKAIWAFGNIAGDCIESRDLLVKQGIFNEIIKIYKKTFNLKEEITATCIWTFTNFCKKSKFDDVCQLVDIFIQIVKICEDEVLLTDAVYGLSIMSEDFRAIQSIVQADIITKLQLLLNQDVKLSIPALSIIKNILTGDEEHKNHILIKPIDFNQLLKHPDRIFIKLVIESIGNITAGNIQQIHRIIYNQPLIEYLIVILNSQYSSGFQKELSLIFINALQNCTFKDTQYLVEKGLIQGLCNQLQLSNNDEEISYILLGIDMLLEKEEESSDDGINLFVKEFKLQEKFINCLKTILNNNNLAIQQKAQDIMKYLII